jgi:D-arabinose 1-dehydrogenase-like Zn-dependent alcohol dehydrogenase
MVFKIPEGFNDAIGSPLLCGATVFAPLKRYYKPNDSCAVIGIGGLGHLAVQYAAKLGMTVTAFTTSINR